MSKDLGLMETEQGTHLGEQHGESREQDSVIGDTLGKFILINGHEIEHNHSEDANELRDENVPDDSFIRPELEIKLSGGGDDLREGSPGSPEHEIEQHDPRSLMDLEAENRENQHENDSQDDLNIQEDFDEGESDSEEWGH
ncbi:hypothetical protein K439DRAFT_1625464 [Ramaria rubella]|nr:hypothetical protein K439DRAFT_1625464 [Ramaria rubella]